MNYTVFDSQQNAVASFKSYNDAVGFKMLSGRPDWKITEKNTIRKSTEKQRKAVGFTQEVLNITFTGDINNFHDCSMYLATYLDDAKMQYEELRCEFEAYLSDLMD